MSNITITDIIGYDTYAIPDDDFTLEQATVGFDALLKTVPNLSYGRVVAWVEDSGGPGSVEGDRKLNCLIDKFRYLGKECPSESEVDDMTRAIEDALESDPSITSVDQQKIMIFQEKKNG